ncbi:Uncharacterized protein dnm_028290 [Desulfonema magnum]|uniref:Uncharacterized protein n=1 Tax=Desulfonema magnum TaxID=45655 RepID=A0A975GMM7_9BACT|nr:Uncharacterized protein dnm_028290 [Desulfonema magnum]
MRMGRNPAFSGGRAFRPEKKSRVSLLSRIQSGNFSIY